MPKVSIVLPTYNGEKYIRQSIDSIINQTFTDWELIIVDDCSTDNTLDIVNEYAKKDNRIRIIHNKINQKLPNSLNIGFAVSNGEYLTWTSDDNYYLSDAFSQMLDVLDNDYEKIMVCADMEIINEFGQVIYREPSYNDKEISVVNHVGACFLYKRCVKDDVGIYDDSLKYVEDYDFWMRIRKRYGKINHINKILYRYRRHDKSLSELKWREVKKALFRMREKHQDFIFEHIDTNPYLLYNLFYDCYECGEINSQIVNTILKHIPALMPIIEYVNIPKSTVVVFGAGDFGRKCYMEREFDVLFFIDNDKSKHGKLLQNVPIYCFDNVKDKVKNMNVVIAMARDKQLDVIMQLWSNNVRNYTIYIPGCDNK